GALTKWSVFVFSLLVALAQLRVADDIIKIVIIGFVSAASLGLGLSFGLGGVKHADEMISSMKRRIND
ncbi:MAG TPA: hypothetical protein VJJ72_00515, partial [Candidatus Paceibacterota bacterium]